MTAVFSLALMWDSSTTYPDEFDTNCKTKKWKVNTKESVTLKKSKFSSNFVLWSWLMGMSIYKTSTDFKLSGNRLLQIMKHQASNFTFWKRQKITNYSKGSVRFRRLFRKTLGFSSDYESSSYIRVQKIHIIWILSGFP